jgi:hypothetical protein
MNIHFSKQRKPQKRLARIVPTCQAQLQNSVLTFLNSRSENVIVEAIIIAKLELCNVEMQVLFTDLVESANDPALENASEAFNRVGVNRADDILALGMVDSAGNAC